MIKMEDIIMADSERSAREREIRELGLNGPYDKKTNLKDEMIRKRFETGAEREIFDGKGRCDLIPLDTISNIFKYIVNSGRNTFLTDADLSSTNEKIKNAAEYNYENIYIFDWLNMFEKTKDIKYLYGIFETFCATYYDNIFTGLLELSFQFEEGAKKYSENNWKKGIPLNHYINSAVRHFIKFLRCDQDEPHDRAFLWNIVAAIWTFENKPELDNI